MYSRQQLINYLKSQYIPQNIKATNWKFLDKYLNENLYRFAYVTQNQSSRSNAKLRRNYRLKYGRPAPFNANVSNLNRKLPKRVLSKNYVTPIPNVRKKNAYTGRKQLKGTCWFQTILNGWLLSKQGRIILKRKLRAFKQSHEMKPYTNIGACPMRKKLPAVYFWSYVEHMLKPRNNKFHSNVMRGIEFPEGKLIRSSHIRGSKNNVEGGTYNDVNIFNEILFPNVKNRNSVIHVETLRNRIDPIPSLEYGRYKLSHAYIMCTGIPFGHAICGYDNDMIFDSNFLHPIKLNWRTNPKLLKKYFKQKYDMTGDIIISATYIDQSSPLRTYNKPEMSHNENTYRENKNISRFTPRAIHKAFAKYFNSLNFINGNSNNVKKFTGLYVFPPPTKSNIDKLKMYITIKNLGVPIAENKYHAILRRLYRLKTGRHAPKGTSSKLLYNSLKNVV